MVSAAGGGLEYILKTLLSILVRELFRWNYDMATDDLISSSLIDKT